MLDVVRSFCSFGFVVLAAGAFACTVDPPDSQGADNSGDEGIDPIGETGPDSPELDLPPPVDLGMVRLDLAPSMGRSDLDPDSMECPDVTAVVEPTIPTVLLMLDQSYSMTFDFPGSANRWEALYETLFDPENGVVYALESRVQFGITLYTTDSAFAQVSECPLLLSQDPMIDAAAVLDELYSSQEPLGHTPTGESLDAIIPQFAAFESDGPKVIVLATDGEPDTCAEPVEDMGHPESLAAAERSFAAGLPLFVISVGTDVSADHLQDMANVGAGKPVDDPAPAPYYQALNPTELVDAFLSIIGSLASCEFTINGEVDLERACEGEVTINGMPVPCESDWQVLDASTLSLVGDACDQLKSGLAVEVAAKWPCDVFIPPG